jgi:glycosyltransferase involved in cell wall biosynthesis
MKADMRVALDLTVPGRAVTGVGVYARELEAALGRRPLTLSVWRGDLAPPVRGWPRLVNAARLTRWLLHEVPRRVRDEGIDVYHSASSLGPLGPGCPWVMTVHDATLLTMRSQYGWADRLYHRVFGVLAARRADALVVPSEAARQAIARAYRIPESRMHVVLHGVSGHFEPRPPDACAPVLRRHGLASPYVLFVGARPPRKNLGRLTEAFGRVRGDVGGGRLELAIAGPADAGDEAAREQARRLGLDGAVRWLGYVRYEELPALYSGALCLAYPSLAEGFGLPILEAMACGTPVLTSARSAMAEVAGQAALLVDPEDPAAIADGLRRLLGDPRLRSDLAACGLARAAGFSWRTAAAATEAVYREVARQSRVALSPGPVA